MSRHRFFLIGLLFESGLGIMACVLGQFLGLSPLATLARHAAEPASLASAVGTGLLGTLPLLVGLVALDRGTRGPLLRLKDLVRTHLVPLFQPLSVSQLGLLSLAAGVGEELLFRGWLQAGVAAWLPGWPGLALGVALASLLFGLCHWLTPTYAALATAVGVFLGCLFLATGSVVAPIVAHTAYDFVALLYLTRRPASG